jgi:hypothetical protein
MKTGDMQTDTEVIRFEATPYVICEWLILQLPENASQQLPSRGQVAVKGAMNGYAFEKVLEPDGRWGHWLKLDAVLQQAANVQAGDAVALEIAPTKVWPEPEIPADLVRALATAPSSVQDLWTKITSMARWEWVRWVNETRNPQTRQRRVEVSISKMQSGKRRPCCFNLAACTDPELSKNGRLIEPASI